ncbi:MAG: hypothetical protein EZS28_013039 [Streblomastix strix]|uniref:Uncharacterized protein n=1 Tax=Streblomastix strix TaxID=222440 RepID=A0A5J4W9U9_9EUKA|nr:MAG: hypothetical protein EZS28_013039 [Streblomastix strix]
MCQQLHSIDCIILIGARPPRFNPTRWLDQLLSQAQDYLKIRYAKIQARQSKLHRDLFHEALSIPWNQLIKDLFLDILENAQHAEDANIRQSALANLQKFWAGSMKSINQELLELSSADFQVLMESSSEQATSVLARFTADLLSTSSQETDVERVFSIISRIVGDQEGQSYG